MTPRLSAGVAWCLVFLALLVTAMRWAPLSVDRYEIRLAAESLRTEDARSLRTVFFGSSRMLAAVAPDEWAERSNADRKTVANLAVNSGRLWDARYIIEQAGGLPPSVDLVVIEIAPYEFNRNLRNPLGFLDAVPEHFRAWAGLGDRLAVDDVSRRGSLLRDWLWPVYQRRPFVRWLEGRTDEQKQKTRLPDVYFRSENIARCHFSEASMSDFSRRSLDALLRALERPDRRIVLLQLPARAAYLDAVEADPASAALSQQVEDIVAERVGHDGVSSITWPTAAEAGVADGDFVDYGHLSPEGALKFTDRLYEALSVAPQRGPRLRFGQRPPRRPGWKLSRSRGTPCA